MMSKDQTPWKQAVALPSSDDVLFRRLRIAPIRRPDLHKLSPKAAAQKLDEFLEVLCHPSSQDLRIVRELAAIVSCHTTRANPSIEAFARNAQCRHPPKVDPRITMLTGPAGVGKTTIAQAMGRAFAGERSVDVPGLATYPIRPVAIFRLGKDSTRAERLNAIAESVRLEPTAKRGDRKDEENLRLRLYHLGCSMLISDETQFLTSSESNARATATLLGLGLLGLPVTYVANYDLGHKLKRRPPQDTARLLSQPIVMLPDPPDDPAFLGLLDDIAEVLGVVQIDFGKHARDIHELTFGLRRCMRRLFVVGYRLMREDRRRAGEPIALTIQHLRAAYRTVDYEESRLAVESCRADLLRIGKPDPYYSCPFALPPHRQHQQSLEAERVRNKALEREREKDARTGEERRREEDAVRAEKRRSKLASPRTSSVRRPKSADEWLGQLRGGNVDGR